MVPILTIFIPSYNRRKKLDRALCSIFEEIERSDLSRVVSVLVVDDFSTEDIDSIIKKHRSMGREVDFYIHSQKRGVAELGMLYSLQYITTRYAWCFGNDDTMIPGALSHLIPILHRSKSSFYLLNFTGREENGLEYSYLQSKQDEHVFESGVDFFCNFGFVTATTTFPCLCFEVEPVKNLDINALCSISPIYSHTSIFFLAFFKSKCSFISRPLVFFNHNDANEEQSKLESRNMLMKKPAFFHASCGLAMLLNYISEQTSIDLKVIASSMEDEQNKCTKMIKQTITCFFIFNFTISQLIYELQSSYLFQKPIYYFSGNDLKFLRIFFSKAGSEALSYLLNDALGIYCSSFSVELKISLLANLQLSAFKIENDLIDKRRFEGVELGFLNYPGGNLKKRLFTLEKFSPVLKS